MMGSACPEVMAWFESQNSCNSLSKSASFIFSQFERGVKTGAEPSFSEPSQQCQLILPGPGKLGAGLLSRNSSKRTAEKAAMPVEVRIQVNISALLCFFHRAVETLRCTSPGRHICDRAGKKC